MLGYEESTALLTAGEVAKLLRLHINTVRRWSDQGMIRSHRVGARGDRRYSLQDVARVLGEHEAKESNVILVDKES